MMARGAKGRAKARQKVKNGKRLRRSGSGCRRRWLHGKPALVNGPGGTDKSATRNNGREPTYRPDDAVSPHAEKCKINRAMIARGEIRTPEEQQQWPA
jgi:hypothetical protein